jgi:tetratricopeptide (TPR) repeat protein/predicted nucleic acid-binding Zn ribbon protein
MASERHCPQCGQIIPWGEKHCPLCTGHSGYVWSLRRDAFLLLLFVLLILLFIITGFAVRSYHDVEKGFAQDWYARGKENLQAGRADAAVADFRTALSYSRDNSRYQLRLAQALMASHAKGASAEAQTYLLNLWEREPGNAIVNLQLARLAARDHAVPDVLRFYHGAIYGEWDADPVGSRRAARMELVQVLLDSGQKDSARAELIGLAADLPADPDLQIKVGDLLVQVGGYDDALKLFREALTLKPDSAPALAGAGECYFQNAQYAEAERYLARALREDPHMTREAAMRDTAQDVLNLNPFDRRLNAKERARRAAQAFNIALARLQDCAKQQGVDLTATGNNPLQNLYAQATELKPVVEERNFSRDSDLLSNTMDVAFDIEQGTVQACGAPQGLDLALLLIAREQGGGQP